MIWNNSKMTVLFPTKHQSYEWPCIVGITDDEISIEYEDDDGPGKYIGKNDGSGHFKLCTPDQTTGQATLHQSPGSQMLEGSWVESGEDGMWRIDLAS